MEERGLTEAEAARRLAEREPYEPTTSRSYASIVRANVLTVFNLILALAGAATLAFGAWQDALFLGVLVSNSAMGIAQEVRAKRALERLATLVAPTATIVRWRAPPHPRGRGGERRPRSARPGDGVVGDGTLQAANDLALDESILTGESRPAARTQGRRFDPARSSSKESGSTRWKGWAPTATRPASPARRARSATRARRSSTLIAIGL
jgi:cation-transporting P-type ATPase E